MTKFVELEFWTNRKRFALNLDQIILVMRDDTFDDKVIIWCKDKADYSIYWDKKWDEPSAWFEALKG